ncbi:MAG: response regulator transcription factor [Synergistetes bacterium]|nr:response regulator transcription factor [Synergistota bacterium]
MQKYKIAIVEDDTDLAELIRIYLEKEGFKVVEFYCGKVLLSYLLRFQDIDLILLDIMLPYLSGIDICKLLKENSRIPYIPIIMITALSEEDDIVKGLESGADDYITKPFSLKELTARIKAVLRRLQSQQANSISMGSLSINLSNRKAYIGTEELELTFSEFCILYTLMAGRGKVFSRAELLDRLWGNDKAVTERTIDVHIASLRKKLKEYNSMIKTVKGVGYKFEA